MFPMSRIRNNIVQYVLSILVHLIVIYQAASVIHPDNHLNNLLPQQTRISFYTQKKSALLTFIYKKGNIILHVLPAFSFESRKSYAYKGKGDRQTPLL